MSAGERRSAICASCHNFEKGGPNGTGPNLYGVVGRAVAGHEGFNYTSALQEFGGEWTYERLDGYLTNSQEYVPGTAMVQRFPREEQRADILAYLGSLADNPVPFPEPAPAEEADVEGAEAQEADAAPDDAPAEDLADGEIENPQEREVEAAEEIIEDTGAEDESSDEDAQ